MIASTSSSAAANLTIDIVVEAMVWGSTAGVEEALRRAIVEAAQATAPDRTTIGEVAVVLIDDAAIRDLNRQWRGCDCATNVLSFPASKPRGRNVSPPPASDMLLGDIVIAYETTAREAAGQGLPLTHHLTHLAVHGFLHLLGYDHELDEPAQAMEQLEGSILERLGILNPYRLPSPDIDPHA
jgi:probable rRNA maturation factor